MPKTAITPTRPQRQEAPAEGIRQQMANPDDSRDPAPDDEATVRSPEEFYAEISKRPDVREILKQLADS